MSLPRTAEYALTNLWSTGTDADTSAYDLTSYANRPGITISGIGRASHRAYAPPGTPACDFVLPNHDGRYSPGGALGRFVGRGPETTLDAVWGSDDDVVDGPDVTVDDYDSIVDGLVSFRLFTGTIDTAPQDIDRPTANVQVRSIGRSAYLLEQSPVIALQESITTSAAWRLVHIACGFTDDDLVIDEGDTTLLYFWANGDRSGADLEQMILGAEGVPSCAYEDSLGRKHFEGRQFRADNARSTTVQWRLFDGSLTTYDSPVDDPLTLVDDPNLLVDGPVEAPLYHLIPARWASNPDEVVRTVKASVNVRTATATQKVWEYGTTLTLAASETRDIEATSSDPFKSAVTPASGTDYTVSAGSLTSVTLLATSGQTVAIRLVAGVGGATVLGVTSNGIQLRAVSLPITTTVPITSTVDTDTSAARFRPQDRTLSIWPEVAPNQALDLVNNFARRYQRPRDQMAVQMANLDATHLYAFTHMQVSDRVQVRHVRSGINWEFFIESMAHGLTDGGGLHRLTLNLERATDDTPSRFGVAEFGFDSFSE